MRKPTWTRGKHAKEYVPPKKIHNHIKVLQEKVLSDQTVLGNY